MARTGIWNADNGDGTYTNPILYTDYSDPDVVRVGEHFYMTASSFCNVPGLPILHSVDLVNWEIINYVCKELPSERYDKPIHGCGVWAPSIRFHGGCFYVCFPMPDEGIFMSTATDPYGEWSKPVNIRPGAGWIDPCPFWDEDGRAYLVAGVAKSRIGFNSVLYMTEMRPDGMGLIGPERIIFDGNEHGQPTLEGPKLYKRNGYYYIFAPAGGVATGWQTVLRSTDIWGPYEYRVVMRQGSTRVNGPHQGAWIDTPAGEDWFVHFQDAGAAGRILHLQPMRWVEDWPVIGNFRKGRDYGTPVLTHKKPIVGAALDGGGYLNNVVNPPEQSGNFKASGYMSPVCSDDFTGGSYNLAWQWNANPATDAVDYCRRGLILRARQKCGAYADQPNLFLQKWPAPDFEWETKLDLWRLTEGDEAGVISLGTSYGVVSFVREGKNISVRTTLGTQHFGKILVEETEEHTEEFDVLTGIVSSVYVRYRVSTSRGRSKVTLSYGTDGVRYKQALTMTAVPGRWVGVKGGLFCVSEASGSEGSVIAEYLRYRQT